MQLVSLVLNIECGGGRCFLQETSFIHPCTSCTFPLPSIPLSLGFSGVLVAIWLFNSPRVGIVLRICLPFFAWIGQIYPRIGFLGSQASHNYHNRYQEINNDYWWSRKLNSLVCSSSMSMDELRYLLSRKERQRKFHRHGANWEYSDAKVS